MNSESEEKLSVDELKQRNLPTEPTPPPVACPTVEQWMELMKILADQYQVIARQHNLMLAQNRLLENMPSTLYALTKQVDQQAKELSAIRWKIEQAGSRKERRRLQLLRIHLPTPSLAWLWIIPILTASAILWYALATLWNEISPLLQLLP